MSTNMAEYSWEEPNYTNLSFLKLFTVNNTSQIVTSADGIKEFIYIKSKSEIKSKLNNSIIDRWELYLKNYKSC